MDLETQTDRRLRAAGITEDDPGLERIRIHNALAYARRDREQHRDSRSTDRGRGTDSGRNRAGSAMETRQRTGAQPTGGELVYLHGGRRSGLKHR